MNPYQNPDFDIDVRVSDLLSKMDLPEKLAQLRNFVVNDPAAARVIDDYVVFSESFKALLHGTGVGSLQCLTRCDFWTNRVPELGFTRKNCARIVNAVQKQVIENSRWGIPLLLFDDCRHGLPGLDATVFPVGIAQASSWNPALLAKVADAVADEMRSIGVCGSIGPNLNLARDPRWSRMEETYGEDPWLAGKLGEAYVRGMQKVREDNSLTAIAAIHFICGMGDAENGIDGRPAIMGRRTLQEVFRPFGMAAKAGARAGMASYSSIDGTPCHANRVVLTELLREQYGFKGLVESDALGIRSLKEEHRLYPDEADCVAAAMKAGLNVDLYSETFARYTNEIVALALSSGRLSTDVIEALVGDVLRVKFELGLFENPYANEEFAEANGRSAAHINLALEIARESIILLSNPGGVLPLDTSTSKRIALIGPHADDIYNLLGDYTPFVQRSAVVTPLDGLRQVAPQGWVVDYARGCNVKTVTPEQLDEAIAIATRADYIVMTLGGSSNRYGQEFSLVGGGTGGASGDADCGEGHDRASLHLFEAQLRLFRKLKELGKPLIAVLVHGRPMCVGEIVEGADAVLDSWYPGEAGGQALAETIFGVINPAGRLPISVPRHEGQLPIYYNTPRPCRHGYMDISSSPLFPFGYGLSYTKFSYTDLCIAPDNITDTQQAEISVVVTNVGERSGDEVVQLYITDDYSSFSRPERELRGFQRIPLQPGESRKVVFCVGQDELMFPGADGNWMTEVGTFTIGIGGGQMPEVSGILTLAMR